MEDLSHLFANNQAWAARIRQKDPEFFLKLSRQQAPQYLWIGCSDSRVPANEIIDLLQVSHIIVCGHYGCSGVQTAVRRHRLGLSDNWLCHIQDVQAKHSQSL